jgi:hypothetical protein
MKYGINLYFSCILILAVGVFGVFGCGSGENSGKSNEKVGDTIGTQDTSLLNNYNNDYPNDRIHMQDSNAVADSSKSHGDTTKGRDTTKK